MSFMKSVVQVGHGQWNYNIINLVSGQLLLNPDWPPIYTVAVTKRNTSAAPSIAVVVRSHFFRRSADEA